MALTRHNEQEIGDILLKVQDELKGLRSLISKDASKIDIKQLQHTLAKVENEIKEKTDNILNSLNSQVKTLPLKYSSTGGEHQQQQDLLNTGSLEALWDLTKKDSHRTGNNEHNQSSVRFVNQNESSSKLALIAAKQDNEQHVVQIKNNEQDNIAMLKYTQFGPSPGQQVKIERETRALFNPQNSNNRMALQENYKIQLPIIEKRTTYKMPTHLITGRTVEHLQTLPLVYKRNPAMTPPAIDENEAKYGLLSLIERGLIPSNAKISFFPVPIESQQIKISQTDKGLNHKLKEISSTLAIESIYKLDPKYNSRINLNSTIEQPKRTISNINNSKESEMSSENKPKYLKKKSESQMRLATNKSNLNNANKTNNVNPLPPPVTPSNALQLQLYDSAKFTHRFVIQNGRARVDLPDYITFKQSFSLRWGSIITIIKYLEDLCQTYSISVGFIDGLKVSELALCIDMDLKPTIDELVDTFLNKDDVEKMVKAPGRKFKRKGGHHLAATIIQCCWRRYRDRKSYLKYRKRKWAAGVIALTWLTYCKLAKAREKLKETRLVNLSNFRKRQRELIKLWPKMKMSKRVIIHIPSLGYSESIRNNMNNLDVRESYQMSRICDILDDNVDIIYVSSIPITEETLQYYFKLLSLRGAVKTGNTVDQKDVGHRYKIVIPEALKSFPTHNMALSTLLKYSPKSLERIKNLIKGRDAYIVPGVMNQDDLYVSDYLNVPILASEPEIANLYTTKSGSKRIFQSAQVSIPFGEFDIYNKEQLYESIAQAITENLYVQRWLFKLDDECDGRGIGFCDISKHLSCYNWALKEMTKFGDKWSKRWAYEPTYVKILEEIPDVLNKYGVPANLEAYPSWEQFQNAFLAQGGVLEAHPPSDSVTSLTVSVLIEPDQSYKILSSGDHIHAESQYSCWGYSFPQTSVDPDVLNASCTKIINACRQRNIIGHLDIDLVTFIDSKTEKQVLWATDLNISYSDHVSLSSLLFYMTNGSFNNQKHVYDIPVEIKTISKKGVKEVKKADNTNQIVIQNRYSVMSSKLYHTNLAVIHYSVFFQTCRALGIGYDIQEKQGTVFSLVDSLNHIHLGMLTISDNLQTAMQQFDNNLKSLHAEISSANMQGKTNFLTASADIKSILNEYNDAELTNEEQNDEEEYEE